MSEPVNENAFKHIFDAALMTQIAYEIVRVYPAFNVAAFMSVHNKLPALEMKARVYLIRDALKAQLPPDYIEAVGILLHVLVGGEIKGIRGFAIWPFAEFIQTYGLDAPEVSLDALKAITPLFTSEWAVRPFIVHYPEITMAYLLQCTQDADEHVRRWASEGSRPRLPWGQRLNAFVEDPSPTLPILDALKFDDALYVRKSVANHLNDITKDHPDIVIALLARWQRSARGKDVAYIDWIIGRALRTLIKAGHVQALALIGVQPAQANIEGLLIQQNRIRLGEYLEFTFTIHSTAAVEQKLVIDYVMHFVKANQSTSPKVFKLKTLVLPAGKSVTLTKSHPVKKITTRDYYGGKQGLQIQLNGVAGEHVDWILDAL